MQKQLHHFVLLAPVAIVGVILLMLIDANVGDWAVCGLGGMVWVLVLSQRGRREQKSAGRCVYCGYNLGRDRRHPNYCPQCGSSQLQAAHILRRREILLEIERLHMELMRNHQQERIARSRKN